MIRKDKNGSSSKAYPIIFQTCGDSVIAWGFMTYFFSKFKNSFDNFHELQIIVEDIV